MQELYVYYPLEPAQAEAARQAFEQLQAALHLQLPGLHSRLLRRPVAADARQTWMEIHRWPEGTTAPEGWPAQLEALARPLAGSTRHVELFEPLR